MTQLRQFGYYERTEIHRRLKVLALAEKLGSKEEACQQMDFDETLFDLYKERYEKQGYIGLRSDDRVDNHPNTTSLEIKNRIREVSILHPDYGAQHLTHLLKDENIKMSPATVHKILKDFNLTSRKSRWLFIEYLREYENQIELTEQQWQFIHKMNPCYLETENRSEIPGEMLVQDCVIIHKTKESKTYLHFVIDTQNNYAFGKLDHSVSALPAIQLLQQSVFPFYESFGLKTAQIITHNGRTFTGNKIHDYQLLMNKYKIKHVITADGHSHGFAKHFKSIIAEEFVQPMDKEILENIDKLEKQLKTWLYYYNNRRANLGYPNYSRFPIELMSSGYSL